MTSPQFAEAYLKAVEKKNILYFVAANLKITNCVVITGINWVSVQIINNDLPFEIKCEIESMFW